MRRFIPWLALALSSPAFAARPLALAEVTDGAARNNPTVGRARAALDGADASVLGALGTFDPQWSLDGGWSRRQQRGFFQGFPFKAETRAWDLGTGLTSTLPTGTTVALSGRLDRNLSTFETDFGGNIESETRQDAYTTSTDLTISQPLLRGVKTAYNLRGVSQARESRELAELTVAQAEQQVLASAAGAYWTWVTEAQVQEITEDSVGAAEEALRVGLLRVEAGDLALVERTRLEAAVVQARTRALEAEVTLRGAADAVLLLMGELPGQDVVPVTEVGDAPEEVVDVAAAIERSLAGNLDLAVAKAQLDLAHRQLSWAKHGRLPSLAATASGGVGAQATTLGDSLGGIVGPEAFPYVRLGGQLDVPIGNRSARANVGQAEATVRQREFDVAETERRIRSDVAIQVARLQTARRAVDLADLNVRLAEETLAAEEALAEAGRRIQKDVLDARLAVEQAAVEAVRARTSWRQAHVELLRLQGALR